jgi:hypothetical protein
VYGAILVIAGRNIRANESADEAETLRFAIERVTQEAG